MIWSNDRLSRRLSLSPERTEQVYAVISEIDAAKTVFRLTDQLPPETLGRLTQSVIVTSSGASTRIEGARLTDQEVEALYRNLSIRKLRTRDEQEVAGYLEVLAQIIENFAEMPPNESLILQLHRDMLRHSEKDGRQRGTYKFGPNRVEARDADGRIVDVIFDPTPPHLTPKEMSELVSWLTWADENGFKHPLIRIANFVFEYLAIHPFQDGNGRTSRLITNLLLLRHGYTFAAMASHERLIEARKAEYYLALRRAQTTWKSADEDIFPWLHYFLSIVQAQAREALALIERDHVESLLSEKQLALWRWAQARREPTFSRREAAAALGFPLRTVEGIVTKLLEMKRLERLGQGRAVRYRVRR